MSPADTLHNACLGIVAELAAADPPVGTDAGSVLSRLAEAVEAYEKSAAPSAQEGDAGRLNWLANRVLYCDYGDNERGGIGWGIRHDLLNGEQFMFGKSIAEAIDAAIAASQNEGGKG